MIDRNSWLFWPDSVALSVLALIVLAMLFLYAARKPMHGVIHSVCNLVTQSTRFISRWLFLSADSLRLRNQSVLLAHSQESAASMVDREFERVTNIIRKDMQEFPALQRKLMEDVTRIEDDYRKCGEVPPPPPEWVDALESVSQLKSGGDIPRKLLEDINKSIQKIHDKTVAEFRRSYEERHKILKGIQPSWRSVDKADRRDWTRRWSRSTPMPKQIDGHMAKFEGIRAKDSKTEHALTVSAFVQLAISSLVMVIALGGAFINYKLIALPMSEMVGASDYITNNLRTSDVAALVIILMEASMGLFLLESLRITQLFPKIASMDDRMRRRLMLASLIFLVILAAYRIVPGTDARHAGRRQGFADARSGRVRTPDYPGMDVEHPDGRPDDHGLRAAVRTGFRGDPAGKRGAFAAHRARRAAGADHARAGFRAQVHRRGVQAFRQGARIESMTS